MKARDIVDIINDQVDRVEGIFFPINSFIPFIAKASNSEDIFRLVFRMLEQDEYLDFYKDSRIKGLRCVINDNFRKSRFVKAFPWLLYSSKIKNNTIPLYTITKTNKYVAREGQEWIENNNICYYKPIYLPIIGDIIGFGGE